MNFLHKSRPAADPRVELMEVTPELARRWMEKANPQNRTTAPGVWRQYATDMREGRWKLTGQTISFGMDGVLLDGQHRLTAIIESGVTIQAFVAFGIDPESVDAVDIGWGRTSGNVAQMKGISNPHLAVATARMILVHRKPGIHKLTDPMCRPSRTAVIALAQSDVRLAHLVAATRNGKKFHVVHASVECFCWYVFSEQDPARAHTFFEEFRAGANLADDNPVFHLRNRLIANQGAKAKLPRLEIIALFFQAWIAYRDRRPVRSLRWRREGPHPEGFPDISLGYAPEEVEELEACAR